MKAEERGNQGKEVFFVVVVREKQRESEWGEGQKKGKERQSQAGTMLGLRTLKS